MACNKPRIAYIHPEKKTELGKKLIVFNVSLNQQKHYERIMLPCGQCNGCRIGKAKEWSLRIMNEASLYNYNSFLTLTYDEDHAPKIRDFYTLDKTHFRNFMKKMRRDFNGLDPVQTINKKTGELENGFPIRYFQCGEYGEQFQRPHHHVCLFNFDFLDKQYFKTEEGYKIYCSDILNETWKNGYCYIGTLTYESASYVAQYCLKKVNGHRKYTHYCRGIDEDTGEMHMITPEHISMSTKPGIGKTWYEKYKEDIYSKDCYKAHGKTYPAPRYYDKLHMESHPVDMELLKNQRKLRAEQWFKTNEPERLKAREAVITRQLKSKQRIFEKC